MRDSQQEVFCAIDYNDDNKKAMKARNEWAKKKREEGYTVKSKRMSPQLMSRSHQYPESENLEWTTCYQADAWKD